MKPVGFPLLSVCTHPDKERRLIVGHALQQHGVRRFIFNFLLTGVFHCILSIFFLTGNIQVYPIANLENPGYGPS